MIKDTRQLIAILANNKHIKSYEILMDFHIAIADLSHKSKDNAVFQIKLQWFIDAILDNGKSGHMEIDNLKDIINEYNLDRNDFITMIESRNCELDSIMFNSQDSLINYAKNTSGILYKNLGKIANINNKEDLYIMEKIGQFYGIIGVIANNEYLLNRGIYNLIYSQNDIDNNYEENILINIKHLISHIREEQNKIFIKNKNLKIFNLLNIFTNYQINCLKSSKSLYNAEKHTMLYVKLIINFLIIKINPFQK